jgi:hypothetical protein
MPENLSILAINELRRLWADAWGQEPHVYIGRVMLEKSLKYRNKELQGGGLTLEQRLRLEQLIKQYKRDPTCFDAKDTLKPGTRLIRMHKGKKHSVLVKVDGFEYQGQIYNSLSKIANDITGKRWNGWVFFGLKKNEAK